MSRSRRLSRSTACGHPPRAWVTTPHLAALLILGLGLLAAEPARTRAQTPNPPASPPVEAEPVDEADADTPLFKLPAIPILAPVDDAEPDDAEPADAEPDDPATLDPASPPPARLNADDLPAASIPPPNVEPAPASQEALLDPQAQRVQAPAPPGAAPAPAPGAPFIIAPESLPLGAQEVDLAVQIFAPATMNINKDATVTIIVKNTGRTDVRNVVVRDILPAGTTFVSSQPDAQPPAGDIVSWLFDVVPAGTEKQIKLVVKPTAKGSLDHAVTLQVMAGSRARTQVLQPELRVEQSIRRNEVLKGQQVQVDITVTNTGDGPARDIIVQADLAPGLTHETLGRVLELDVKNLAPNQPMTLDPLYLKAVEGGEQSISITARSPDVVYATPDAAPAPNVKTINVVEPKLVLELTGPTGPRYTDTEGEYLLKFSNPGTAPAEDVVLTAALAGDGRPYKIPDATWDPSTRKFTWNIGRIEAGATSREYVVRVRYGGLGIFKLDAEARGRGGLRDLKTASTSIEGNADVELAIEETKRIIDVGETTVYEITIKNLGTKDARQIQVNAELSPNLEATETGSTVDVIARVDPANKKKIVFDAIPALAPGTQIRLGVGVKATAPGLATCRVYAAHDDLHDFGDARLERVASTKVVGGTLATGRADTPPPK